MDNQKKLDLIEGYLLMRKEELAEYKKYNFNKEGYYNIKIEDFFNHILKIIRGD